MYINFFGPVDFIGLKQKGAFSSNSLQPGGGSSIFLQASGPNTYAGNTPVSIGSYTQGLSLTVLFATTNTGPATLNVNGLGSIPIKKNGGTTALANGDIIAGGIYTLVYDGTEFQIVINTAL